MKIALTKTKKILAHCMSWLLIILSFVVITVHIKIPGQDFLKEWKSQDQGILNWKPLGRFGVFSPGIYLEGALLPFGANAPLIENKQQQLSGYILELEFATRNNSGWLPFFSLNFCSMYKWVLLTQGNFKRTGVYVATSGDEAQFISRADYSDLEKKYSPEKNVSYKLLIDCDLGKQLAAIYVDDKFYEQISLRRQESLSDFYISVDSDCYLRRIRISDKLGRNIFKVDYSKRLAWIDFLLHTRKEISYILLLIGIIAVFVSSLTLHSRKIVFLLSLFAVICCSELFLRITEKDNPYFNIQLLMKNPMWNIEYTTNLLGNYNEAKVIVVGGRVYSVDKPEGVVRIVCLGSSSTQGHGIKDKRKVYTSVLEDKINRSGIKCEVINAGLGGDETLRMSIFLREVLIKLNPDIVTVYLAHNDTLALNDYRSFYAQYKRMQDILLQNPELSKNQRLLFMALEFKKTIKPVLYVYNYLSESYLFMYINQLRRSVLAKLYNFKKSFPLEEKKKIWEESLRDIIETCRRRGIKVLFIPELVYPNYDSTSDYRVLMQNFASESNQVYYLDLREAFIKKSDVYLFYDGVHPTEFGHEIIATEIYNKLKSGNLLK